MEQIVIAQFFVKTEYINKFKAQTTDLIEKTRQESDCIYYHLYQSIENETDFIFYEKFKDADSFDSHLKSQHYLLFSEGLKSLQSQEPIVKIL